MKKYAVKKQQQQTNKQTNKQNRNASSVYFPFTGFPCIKSNNYCFIQWIFVVLIKRLKYFCIFTVHFLEIPFTITYVIIQTRLQYVLTIIVRCMPNKLLIITSCIIRHPYNPLADISIQLIFIAPTKTSVMRYKMTTKFTQKRRYSCYQVLLLRYHTSFRETL